MSHITAVGLVLLLTGSTGEPRLVVSSGLRLRTAPAGDAAVAARAGIGEVLTCLARSAPVQLGDRRGAFCETRLDDGRTAWFFEPMTEALAADRERQLQALVARRLGELAGVDETRWPDVHDLHHLLRRRLEQAADREARLRARLDELRLLQANPRAFHGDPRVYRDEAQGWRLRREALHALVVDATGTPVAEEAAWLAVQHGHDFECEGYSTCVVSTFADVECRYLQQFPRGPHAAAAIERIAGSAEELAPLIADSEMGHEGLDAQLARVRTCLAPLTLGPVGRARAALQAIEKAAHRSPAASP